jgi:propanediol dehydratase small subunit|tara:strand:+ start:2857 stop:3285 length:429 start_codon:yes stop_codon:yes gene_type:complete
MRKQKLTQKDYPIAETQPSKVKGKRGIALSELTMDAVLEGRVALEDLQITPEALLKQAEIAKSVGRATLSGNFERAAEMNKLPNSEVMEIYELLRPGRAGSKSTLLEAAQKIRSRYSAEGLAEFIEEAAEFYDKRGLFKKRY